MKPISSIVVCALMATSLYSAGHGDATSFIGPRNKIKGHASTVPSNGDVNPHGVAVVPQESGDLHQGHVLVSNFNNSMNFQGTGTTIVEISPGDGSTKLFAHIDATKLPGPCPGGVGLTTALVVLQSGWVIVGSLPTSDGMAATAKAGCLLVLNNKGAVVETISSDEINGPWDMTALDKGTTASLFVTNVLNGTVAAGGGTVTMGTVLRIDLSITGGKPPQETGRTIIGSGFPERTDPMALVIGPTGVGLGADGTLYVADTLGNRIAAISNAAALTSGGTVTTLIGGGGLTGPLGLAIAEWKHSHREGNMVETTPKGVQVTVKFVDLNGPPGAGDLFGLAIRANAAGVYFVNDGTNTLDLLH
ncbi:MAG TPA: hypothetical protein VEV85_10925 [Bryobacteraceae bacterium]|nr:hypothetical protein [Bryobacteraceae bacterium]